MSIDTELRIGADVVDLTRPGDVLIALRKMQLRLASGGLRETLKMDGEEVTFQRADDARLAQLIAQYEAQSARALGQRRRGARRVRWA